MDDLRVDKGMGWMPKHMWLSYLTLGAAAAQLRYDLALDATGTGRPSYIAAGLASAIRRLGDASTSRPWEVALAIGLALGAAVALGARRFALR